MTAIRWSGTAWLLIAGVLGAAALAGAGALLVPDPPQPLAVPAAGQLVALEPYLDPSESNLPETPGVPESVAVRGNPFGGETVLGGGPDGGVGRRGGGGGPAPGWTLSAVMIAGDRRIAIVNDQMVRPGDRLEDGARVEAVGSSYIVIITPDGERRRLEIER